MAAPKRASMREGPLAALFRQTEGDDPTGAESPDAATEAPAPKERLKQAFSAEIPANVLQRERPSRACDGAGAGATMPANGSRPLPASGLPASR